MLDHTRMKALIFLVIVIFSHNQCQTKKLFIRQYINDLNSNCSSFNQSDCQFCGPGKYYNLTLENCNCCQIQNTCDSCPECDMGYFNDVYNATQCKPCDKGYFNKFELEYYILMFWFICTL